MTFEVKVYDKVKYEADSKVKAVVTLGDVDNLEVIRMGDENVYALV